jgi:hypothetical protein
MKAILGIALIMLLSAVPSRLLAKGATTKVVIEQREGATPAFRHGVSQTL